MNTFLPETSSVNNAAKRGFLIALIGTILATGVVGMGAFTRLVHAGLGCPDWPGCYGHLMWPDDVEEINAANARFPEIPVDEDKTWPEMVHRYIAGILGLFIFTLAVIALRNKSDTDYPFRLPLFMALLVVWQALFGMWTVTLKLWPQVVSIHLMGGISTLTLMWVLTVRLAPKRFRWLAMGYEQLNVHRKWAYVGVILVFCQIWLGGWVAANYAALACVDFPTCKGSFLPAMNMVSGFNVFQHIGPNYLGGLLDGDSRTAIHFVHRIGALVVTLYLVFLSVRLWRTQNSAIQKFVLAMVAVLVLQVTLGISNVVFHIPLPVAVAHNLVGALLLILVSTLALESMAAREAQGRLGGK